MRRGQVAFEYMVVVAIVLGLLVPIWTYIANVNAQSAQALAMSQAQTAANKIVSAADLVYTQGPPTRLTINVYVPTGVQGTSIEGPDGNIINFEMYFQGSPVDVHATSIAYLHSSAAPDPPIPTTEGNYKIRLEALSSGQVEIIY